MRQRRSGTEGGAGTGERRPDEAGDEPPAGARYARRPFLLTRLHRDQWTDDRELAHAIHGTVVGAAAMAAASLHGTLGEVVVTVLVTVAVYWAAERYARVLAVAVRGPQLLRKIAPVLRRGWPMVEAAYTPLIVLVAVEFLTEDLRTSVLAALGVATVMLGGLGHAAARRAETTRAAAVGWAMVSAGLGVVVILLKISLH